MKKRLFEISQDISKYKGVTCSFCISAKDENELYFLLFQKGYKKGTYTVKEFVGNNVEPTEINTLQCNLFG